MGDLVSNWQNGVDGPWRVSGVGRIARSDPTTGNALANRALADAADRVRGQRSTTRTSRAPSNALSMMAGAKGRRTEIADGGRVLNSPAPFSDPTVPKGVSPDAEMSQNEAFGPVVLDLAFRDEAEVIKFTIGTDYSLGAGVFTTDLDCARGAIRHLNTGQAVVNEWYVGSLETPFGGFRKSGYGHEKGREAL
ncbi:MAG: aldehyde dehydrogenase family protein [Pseudomonadota bacterium]